MKKILITGGSGFIGYHLAKYLAARPDIELVLVDNFFRSQIDEDLKNLMSGGKIQMLNLDLTDPKSYEQLGNGYDQVYHLAAVNGTGLFYEIPHEVLRINTLSLIYMLEWFRKENAGGKFCFTSSNEAYAGALKAFGQLPIPTPENVPLVVADTYNPRWSYGSSKLIGEMFVIHYARAYNFRALIVRPHNFYGPRAGYKHVIPEWCQKIMDKVDPFLIPGADETRTFCFINDAVKAMTMLMDSSETDDQPIETVHIGDTREIKISDLAELMFEVTGFRPSQIKKEASLPGSVSRRLADIGKINKLVGWQPQTPLAEGLKLTYDWYMKHPQAKL